MVIRAFLLSATLSVLGGVSYAQDCTDTDTSDDLDLDGFTTNCGDCNDDDDEVFPDAPEICDDDVDQDCDGVADEGCDVQGAELLGGSGCGARGGWTMLFLPLPLLLLGRRR